jgi:SpoVK/Ycf46/Vps4 family AAA+-type ATPase
MDMKIIEEAVREIQSGTAAIHICGDDYNRIDKFIEKLASDLGFIDTEEGEEKKVRVVEWNYGYGQVDFKTRAKIGNPPNQEKITFPSFLETYKNTKKYAWKRIILVRNARHILEGEINRENLAQLQQTIVLIKKHIPGKSVIIYSDEKRFIPDELSSLVYFLDVKPPSQDELAAIARSSIEKFSEVDEDLVKKLSSMCVGMSEDSFRQILKKAEVNKENFAKNVKELAEQTKKQFVDKSGLLKFVVEDDKNDVGGLGYLKWWLDQKKVAFEDSDEAKEKGISPAKGILLAGMPGCGKSLTSKFIAKLFNLPLLSLDLGSLMGKYLGESEENLRRALRLAENSSPCVLWVDEIEKAFAGVKGDESGVSQRLFGYLLTWLNDKKAHVFVIATANDVTNLPPELLRRGRFDEIFYVGFPNIYERKAIFKIHLDKALKGWQKKFEEILKNKDNENKFDKLAKNTEGYAGSDIAALVNNAVERIWRKEKNLKTELLEAELLDILHTEQEYMIPLEKMLAEMINKNKEAFKKNNFTSAAETEENLRRYEEISSDGSEKDKLAMAKEERCPERILMKLAKNGNKQVKIAVLENPKCTPPIMINLVNDAEIDAEIREEAIKKLPVEVLTNLANTSEKEVIDAILNLDSVPAAVLLALRNRGLLDNGIKAFLLAHPKFPEEKKKQLGGQASVKPRSCSVCLHFIGNKCERGGNFSDCPLSK